MKNPSRMAAKVTGVIAAGALVFGVIGPAGAAIQDVEFRLDPGQGTITLPTDGDPVVISLLDATGVAGTYDDVTGDFEGSLTTAPIPSTRPAPAPAPPGSTINQITTITSPADGVTGTIDPVTGEGTVTAPINVSIYLDRLSIPPVPTELILDYTCTIPTFNITYDVTATKVPADSVNFTNLALTSQPFTVQEATCVAGPNTNPAIPQATVQDGLNNALALPNSNATSALALVAGAIPPPPPTTNTTIPATTPTTTPGSTAPPPVVAQPRFTG